VEVDGERFMSALDFVCRFLGLIPAHNFNEETVHLLANVVDTTKDGWDAFLLCCYYLLFIYYYYLLWWVGRASV